MKKENLLEVKNFRIINDGIDMNCTRVLLQNVFEKMGIQVVYKKGLETEYELYFKYNNQYDEDDECPNRMGIDNECDGLCNLTIRLDSIKVRECKFKIVKELLDEINSFLRFGEYDIFYIEDDYYQIEHHYYLGDESQDPNCVEPVIQEIIRNHRLFVPLILETIRRNDVFNIVCNDIMKRSCSV